MKFKFLKKDNHHFIDSYYIYNKSVALSGKTKHFGNKYSIMEHGFVVKYLSEFESNKGYEMSFDL